MVLSGACIANSVATVTEKRAALVPVQELARQRMPDGLMVRARLCRNRQVSPPQVQGGASLLLVLERCPSSARYRTLPRASCCSSSATRARRGASAFSTSSAEYRAVMNLGQFQSSACTSMRRMRSTGAG